MILALAAVVVPILNVVETTKVQGVLNDYLTQGNVHMIKNKKHVEDYLYSELDKIVGTEANSEIIMYAYRGTVPTGTVADPDRIPNLSGIRKKAGYYQVSALVVRIYWVQKKLVADKYDEDGEPIGRCFYCGQDELVERILFVPEDAFGNAYQAASADLEFVRDPALLFEQFN